MPRDLDSLCGYRYFNMFCLYLLIPKLLIGGLPQLMHTLHDVEASNGGHVQNVLPSDISIVYVTVDTSTMVKFY